MRGTGGRSSAFANLDKLSRTRDLTLPDWGPYSRDHFAISHICNKERGTLFECIPIPGIACVRKYYPDKKDCLNYLPVDANADLSFYAMHCEMDYGTSADMRFYAYDDDVRLAEVVFMNNGRAAADFRLDYALGFQFEGEHVALKLRKGEHFLAAHRYEQLSVSLPRSNWDQRREGVSGSSLFVERLALGPAFTVCKGASARYRWEIARCPRRARLGIRYALSGRQPARVRLLFQGKRRTVALKPTGGLRDFESLQIRWLPPGPVADGVHDLTLVMQSLAGGGELHVDGFFLAPPDADPVREGRLRPIAARPDLRRHVEKDFAAIQSPLAPGKTYGILVDAGPDLHPFLVKAGDMGPYNRRMGVSSRYWTGDALIDDENEHSYVDLRPLTCEPSRSVAIRGVVGVADSVPQLRRKLRNALGKWEQTKRRVMARHERTAFTVRDPRYRRPLQTVMAATLTTLNYPQDFGNEYVRHLSPGAFYPTLYLWDAGMQGLGLMHYAPQLSLEGLNTYLAQADENRSLILHGTVLPTQFFQYWELFQHTGDRRMLGVLYPKMRRYYRFMAGKDGSQIDCFGTGLLCPWMHFYNSGGWDDYPAQVHVVRNNLRLQTSPVVNTAYTIRGAKLMALAALELGERDDVREYLADARRMTDALLKYSWDEGSGYFSYVRNRGKKKLEFAPGVNFNMGLDGVSPLVAGIESHEIERRLIAHCRNPERLWTRFGLSTVDQSAPYFDPGGYWNGAVWVGHHWFFFKALLDLGQGRFAAKLAQTILDAWRNAVELGGGQTFEAISIRTGRPFGTHYFSALLMPAVALYKACLEPGCLTGGFDTVVGGVKFDRSRRRLRATVSNPLRPGKAALIANLGRGGRYLCRIGEQTKTVKADKENRIVFTATIAESPMTLDIAPAGKAGH